MAVSIPLDPFTQLEFTAMGHLKCFVFVCFLFYVFYEIRMRHRNLVGRLLSVLFATRKEFHFISVFSRNNCKFWESQNALTSNRFRNNSIRVTRFALAWKKKIWLVKCYTVAKMNIPVDNLLEKLFHMIEKLFLYSLNTWMSRHWPVHSKDIRSLF